MAGCSGTAGCSSNTPLSPAINALEEAAGGDPAAVREVIVVELFPMNAPVPRSLLDVLQRMVQLQYTSRLKLDKHFFDKVDGFVDLIATIEKTLPKTSPVRDDPIYKDMLTYRKINHFNVVTSTIPANLTTAADFSRSSIEARIDAGYHDAIAPGIGSIDAPRTPRRRHRPVTRPGRYPTPGPATNAATAASGRSPPNGQLPA